MFEYGVRDFENLTISRLFFRFMILRRLYNWLLKHNRLQENCATEKYERYFFIALFFICVRNLCYDAMHFAITLFLSVFFMLQIELRHMIRFSANS